MQGLTRSTGLVGTLALALTACGAGPEGDVERPSAGTAAVTASPVLTFTSSWTDSLSGPLVAGQPVTVAYDSARLVSQCGGDPYLPGNPGFAWGITGNYTLGSAAPAPFQVSITSAWASGNATFTPPAAGDLAMWFGCGSTIGHEGWDSNYGLNYHFPVVAPPPAGDGLVQVRVLADQVVNGAVVSTPLRGALIYDGLWEAGSPLGQTDPSGLFAAALPVGAHDIGVMMMTSSHSMLSSDGNAVTVSGTPAAIDVHVAPTTVSLTASYDAGYGNALYITGETSYLGSWQTAYRLTSTGASTWTFQKNLPLGAQFKLILAPWGASPAIATSAAGVKWEQGSNQVVPAPVNYFESVVSLTPAF